MSVLALSLFPVPSAAGTWWVDTHTDKVKKTANSVPRVPSHAIDRSGGENQKSYLEPLALHMFLLYVFVSGVINYGCEVENFTLIG